MISSTTIILTLVLMISSSHAQDTIPSPSSSPTLTSTNPSTPNPSIPFTLYPTTRDSPQTPSSDAPISSPILTFPPTDDECSDNPDWYYEFWDYTCNLRILNLTCGNDQVSCWNYGNLGLASTHCCKCKSRCLSKCNADNAVPMPRCDFVNDDAVNKNEPGTTDVVIIAIALSIFWAGIIYALCRHQCRQGERIARRQTQETMVARRRQQREERSQGLTEEERNYARYELFVTKFLFQTVLPDKSNISADSLRSSEMKLGDENHHEGGSMAFNASNRSTTFSSSFSRPLSSWRRPSPKDECCVCLESYNVGETICAPITTECNHVFHEACILQWLKNHDKCPLCRVDLLKD